MNPKVADKIATTVLYIVSRYHHYHLGEPSWIHSISRPTSHLLAFSDKSGSKL